MFRDANWFGVNFHGSSRFSIYFDGAIISNSSEERIQLDKVDMTSTFILFARVTNPSRMKYEFNLQLQHIQTNGTIPEL